MRWISCLIILKVIFACVSVQAVTFLPTDDTFIDEHAPSTIYGTQQHLIIRDMNLLDYELDTLLKFNLGSIPANTFINSAKLNLYYYHYNDANPSGNPLNVHRITGAWSESTTNWNICPTYDTNVTSTVSGPGSYSWIQWDVRSDVQDFVKGTKTNYGWQIMDASASSNSMIYFRSKEYTDGNYRPFLEVEYGTIYVDVNAAGSNNGTSWTDAFNKLQDALAIAASGDQIWGAEGTYKPDQGGGETPGDANATFQLISGVTLFGGFAGGEASLQRRDWENNITTLSGDIGVADNNSDNSFHVVTGSATDSTAVIDGFTITQGNARGSIERNGGGMYTYQGSPTVINCTFIENTAQYSGGGMFNDYHSDMNIINCTFIQNVSQFAGAGMGNEDSSPTVINCLFEDNSADDGGGMYNDELSNPVLINCAFLNNSADSRGGGIRNHGGTWEDSCPTLVNCTFTGNSAGLTGGGMYTGNEEEECDPVITNCIFWGNTSDNNSVVADQIDGEYTIVTYSCIQDSDPDDGSIPFGGAANNNIDDNPMFKDAGGGDLRLTGSSPCIEAGSNAAVPADTFDLDDDGNTAEPTPLDLNSRNRFSDGNCSGDAVVDMGAYELVWIYIGDLNNDCCIDFYDFSIMASNWLAGK